MAFDLCRAEHTVVSRSGKLGLGDAARWGRCRRQRGAMELNFDALVATASIEKDSERLNTFWFVGVLACDRGHLVHLLQKKKGDIVLGHHRRAC